MATFVIIVLAAGLVFSVVKMRAGEDWARTATPVLAVLIIVFGPVRLLACRSSGPGGQAMDMESATSFEQTCAREFATAAGKFMRKGSKALVFVFAEGPEFYESMVAGLKEGLGAHGVTLGPMLPPIEAPQHNPGLQAQQFKDVLAKHPDVGGCLIYGNPIADMEEIKPPDDKVQVGIMAHRLKPKEAIKRVKEGGIAVVVLPKPNINWAKVVRISNPDKRFARTYLVITRDNVAEVEKELQ